MKSISTRIEHRSESRTKCQRHHDMRSSRIPNYVDQDRIKDNSVIVQPIFESEIKKICNERRNKRLGGTKRKMKFSAAITTVGIITFSNDAQPDVEKLSKTEQDKLFLMTAEKIANRLNTTLTSLVVHRDESAIHAHYQLISVDNDGFVLSQTTTKRVTSELQDVAAQAWSDLSITRGERKWDRIARGDDLSAIVHRGVNQLHADLPAEIAAAEEKAKIEIEKTEAKIRDAQEKLEKYTDLAEKAEKRLSDGIGDAEKVEKRLEKYQNRIAKAREILESQPRLTSKKVDIVTKTQRAGGLLPAKIEIEQKNVIEKEQVQRWVHSFADEQARKERKLADKESEMKKRESALEQRLATVKSESEQLATLRSELHDLGRDLADDPQTLARFEGLIADEIKAGVEQVHFERAESTQNAAERDESKNQYTDSNVSL